MKPSRMISLLLIGMLAFTMLLAGCSKSNQAAGDKKPSELVIAQDANPTTMDPHDTQDTLAYGIQKTMYEGLLGFDKDMKVIPVLAEAMPELAKDAKSITFKLKKGVKFQDGTDFNAEAVKANIDRLKDPANKLKRASLYTAIDHVEIIDPYTVKIVLNKPFAPILQAFAHPAGLMISPKAIKEYGKDLNRHPVGTGPFQFVEWKDGQYVIVKKFDAYWDKANAAKVDKITFKPVTESASRVAMLKTGEAQFIYPLPSEQVEAIKGDSNIVVDQAQSIIERYVVFNVTKKPFDDKRIRQALNYAVDKDALAKVVYKGFASAPESAFAPKVWGFQKQQMYAYDVEKAKKLLAEAGVPNGFEVTLWTPNDTVRAKLAEFVQQQWQAIGVKATIQQMDFVTLTNQLSVKPEESKLQVAISGWSPSTGEADWGIRPLLTKNMFPTAGFNVGFYANDQLEKFVTTGLESGDEKERLNAYGEAQKTIVEDAPWVFLTVQDNLAGKRKNLSGVYVLPDAALDVRGAAFQ
ncbi:glutathione ABC transporter substrate-binding protein [Sporomusa malonica]|uniref:Glutathione-binding protein GsiB n=1 Tax=Sporomusa malonica TaxID=112901 RepID=A0A1W1ZMZ3_9FIRM|nr:glutathione ABC transporter substrate-binding protein [Sporomusa malonica]SMC49764.1 glutathione transport system substrate-binding protein [Sporomusa malonica]